MLGASLGSLALVVGEERKMLRASFLLCVVGESLHLSGPQFSHWSNEDSRNHKG